MPRIALVSSAHSHASCIDHLRTGEITAALARHWCVNTTPMAKMTDDGLSGSYARNRMLTMRARSRLRGDHPFDLPEACFWIASGWPTIHS